ncbi:MAG: PolC-type DNA polymerase III [Oscillospiraceae bacterium]|nr:PolC-type DNA polymerase III [Oscillospiraceae bacterium]
MTEGDKAGDRPGPKDRGGGRELAALFGGHFAGDEGSSLGKARLTAVGYRAETGETVLKCESEALVGYDEVTDFASFAASAMGLDKERLSVWVRYALDSYETFFADYRQEIVKAIEAEDVILSRQLSEGEWSYGDGALRIGLRAGIAGVLKEKGGERAVGRIVGRMVPFDVRIAFDVIADRGEAAPLGDGPDPDAPAGDGKNPLPMPGTPNPLPAPGAPRPKHVPAGGDARAEAAAAPKSGKRLGQGKRPDQGGRPKRRGGKAVKGGDEVVMGSLIKEKACPMTEVGPDSRQVTVEGDLFGLSQRRASSGSVILTFYMTDYEGSVTVKAIVDGDDADYYGERVRDGARMRVSGEVQVDRFMDNEPVIRASSINELNPVVLRDDAPVKRVELHAHTQMSAMDGVTPIEGLIKRAADYGHRAVAITDHGVLQGFPEAYKASLKHGVKLLYGLECYMVEAVAAPYIGKAMPFGCDAVILDLETTGLSKAADRIVEIGAVRVSGGAVVSSFHTYVDPGFAMPAEASGLTGIGDGDLAGAPAEGPALRDLLGFVGGSLLVAHNAPFDLGFLEAAASRAGLSLGLDVFDTLGAARALLPELPKHSLKALAAHFGISLEAHHTAEGDARATAELYGRLIKEAVRLGCTEHGDVNGLHDRLPSKRMGGSHHATLIARTQKGIKALYRLVSLSHLKYFNKKPRIPKNHIKDCRDDLVIGSACESGEVFSAALAGKAGAELEGIASFYDYLEIQPNGNNRFLIDGGRLKDAEALNELNRGILALGKKLGKPVAAACDVHFLGPRDEVFRRIMMKSMGFADAEDQAPLYFRTTSEMLAEFAYLGGEDAYEVVVEGTNKVADMVDDGIVPIPKGIFAPRIEGAEETVREVAYARAHELYGPTLPPPVADRLGREIDAITRNGFAVMYYVAYRLVRKSNEDGYIVGSRGSVGSSLVASMCSITENNPLPPHYLCPSCRRFELTPPSAAATGCDLPEAVCPDCGSAMRGRGENIPFETFLGFDGEKAPDIDLNFAREYQDRAHAYAKALFEGRGEIYRAGTILGIAEKTAFGFVKNYFEEKGQIINKAEEERLIAGCTGVKRTTGQHPGGLIIIPEGYDIHDFTPIQRPADLEAEKGGEKPSDVITTHFDYSFLHKTVMKLDILGHKYPTHVRILEDLTGVAISDVPECDPEVLALFRGLGPLGIKAEDLGVNLGTLGLPEMGTEFVMKILAESRPESFSDLIQISGLSHGKEVWQGNACDLIKGGTCTLSEVISTRDDIMTYLIGKGVEKRLSFLIMEDVRDGLGLKPEYVRAMAEKGVPGWYIDSCRKIKYLFPKGHAVAYVLYATKLGWFKVRHMGAFYSSLFTVEVDDFDVANMASGPERIRARLRELEAGGHKAKPKEKVEIRLLRIALEMYLRGMRFLPVDIYGSDVEAFKIIGDGLLPPLRALQGVGAAAAESIARARADGTFLSVEDLRARAKAPKHVIDCLRENGCLASMPESNQITFFDM